MVIACIDLSNDGHRLFLMRSLVNAITAAGHTAICITSNADKVLHANDSTLPTNNQALYYSYNYIVPDIIRWSSKINDIATAVHYWKQYHTLLKKIETAHTLKIDTVLINYMDVFLSCWLPIWLQRRVFKFDWAGLYIHPRYMRMFKEKGVQNAKTKLRDIDYIFTSRNCVGIGVFDNGIYEALSFRLDKKVTLMPDISDVSTDNNSYVLADEIKNAAKGRTIVGTIGISYYAGVIDLIKLASACAEENYFFVFCGVFDEASYHHIPSEEDKALLRSFRKKPFVNCLWKEGYIEKETEYNAVFNTLDILYMVYPEHYTSSNRLTKAAYFQTFVLAANQHCVGENVLNFKLGEVAEPGNIPQQLDKLFILNEKLKTKAFPLAQWQLYYSMNSEQLLQKQLKSLLNT